LGYQRIEKRLVISLKKEKDLRKKIISTFLSFLA
jgi:hypothetical protein